MIHLLNALHKTTLTFESKTNEKGDVWTFVFTPDRYPPHIAGQHAAFIIKGVGYHVFSLANAPGEGKIMIGTHVREGSRYKTALAGLMPGDQITMYGPILNFTLERAPQDIIFLAQGIGITPFRSLLLQQAKAGSDRRITLVHSDGPEPTYRSLLEPLATTHYPLSPDEFTQTVKTVTAEQPDALYYLSGSPGFLKGAKATLRDNGIATRQMKTDQFWGYRS